MSRHEHSACSSALLSSARVSCRTCVFLRGSPTSSASRRLEKFFSASELHQNSEAEPWPRGGGGASRGHRPRRLAHVGRCCLSLRNEMKVTNAQKHRPPCLRVIHARAYAPQAPEVSRLSGRDRLRTGPQGRQSSRAPSARGLIGAFVASARVLARAPRAL